MTAGFISLEAKKKKLITSIFFSCALSIELNSWGFNGEDNISSENSFISVLHISIVHNDDVVYVLKGSTLLR